MSKLQDIFLFQVTPAGYAKMTEMLNDLSSGKLLVILEGGFVTDLLIIGYCSVSTFPLS